MPESIKQKLIKSFLDIYLYPLKLNSRLKRFSREVILMDEAEHLSKPIQFLKSNNLLSKEPVIIDIGGANGDTTSFFLKEIPGCRIFTFEANPDLASEVKKKFADQNVKVFAMALSDKKGTLNFHITDNSLSSSYKTIVDNKQFHTVKSVDVPSDTLDAILEKEENISFIDLIKLDVQGAESDVLRGAQQILQKTKIVIVEQSVRSSYVGGSMYYEIDETLRKAGFELLDIIITYRKDGLVLTEFDSIYILKKYSAKLQS